MRAFLPVIAMLVTTAAASKARADTGVFFEESFSAAFYNGGMRAYGDTAFRFTFSMDVRRDAWTVAAVGGFAATDDLLHTNGDYSLMGADVRRTWQLNYLHPFTPRRAGVRFSLEAGPRWFGGQRALTGYDGPGASASARLEGDFYVISYYLQTGLDVMWMQMPVDSVVGAVPFAGIGAKVGWL